MKKSKFLAVIPARGGSKRIPGKNVKDFLGQPILSYSIKAAIETHFFDEVIVSTDDENISKLAESYGATIPFFRSSKNADDMATVTDVLLEVIAEYERLGKEFDYLCCIYATAPFLTSKKIRAAFNLMLKTSASVVLPVVKFSYPIQRALIIDRHDRLNLIQNEHISTRSQDLTPTYHDAAQFIWLNVPIFKKSKLIFNDNVVPYILNEHEVQDIDSEQDWQLAELKYRILKTQN